MIAFPRLARLALACTLCAVSSAHAEPTTRPAAAAVPMIVAHRGASADAPENTLAAMRLGLAQGADALETDLHLTRDGKLIVIHDKDTARTCEGPNAVVAESTFDELRKRDAGRWKGTRYANERLPTPAEILALVPPGRKILLEVKCGPEAVPALARDVRASGLAAGQVIIISFNAPVIAAAKQAMPDHLAFYLYQFKRDEQTDGFTETADAVIARAKSIGADGLDLGMNAKSRSIESLTPELVAKTRAAGLSFHVWTVDDVEVARRAIALGVDSITTNRPAALRAELDRDAH